MKKSILIFLSILATLTASAQNYTIKGEVPDSLNGDDAMIVDFEKINVNGVDPIVNKTTVADGHFEMSGTVENPKLLRFQILHNNRPSGHFANIILEPGEMTIDFENHVAQGTKLNDANRRFFLFEKSPQGDRTAWMDRIKELLRENDNPLGASVLWAVGEEELDSPADFLSLYEISGESVRNYAPLIALKAKREFQNERLGDGLFKDFTFPTGAADSTQVRLSDYIGHGRYILLEFFASWCGACLKEIPALQRVYEKFHGDRFEILGIAVNDDRAATQRAIASHQILWPVIFDAPFSLVRQYGSNGIPLLVLISPEGKILAHGIRGEETMKAVEKYIGN